jgi:hypothetical protein
MANDTKKSETKFAMLQLDLETHKILKEYCNDKGLIMKKFVTKLILNTIKENK